MNRVTVSTYPTRVTLHCGQNKVTLRYAQKGERGIGISNVALDDKAHLIVTYDDGKTQDAGAALGDVASVKDGIDSSYKKIQTSEANVTKLEASTKANADKARQALQDTQSASTSGVGTINMLVSEKMTYMTSTFNSLLTQAKANIDQLERDAEDKIHRERTYSLEQIKTAHDDAMVDIERSVNKAEAWAVSETTPDKEPDFESPTGLTQSSRSWALLSKKEAQEAFDTLKDIKDNETNVSNMKNDVTELLRKTQASEQNTQGYMNDASASQKAAKESENTAETYMENAKTSEVNAKASETASADSASKAHTSEMNSNTSETSAATSASNAKASETNAKTSETNAAESQQSATSSATIAKNWAIATTSPDGDTDADSNTGKTQSSRSWALASKASAESASSSASTATTQASSATASANSASKSATSASESATSASASATAASNSASAAATSATNASNSETQAYRYKTAASDSATAAASSATSASTSATNAKASMNTANTAASSANTSSTNASTSASNAIKAEVAAKTAQAAAEKARDDANSAVNKLTGAMKYAGQVDNYSDLADVTKNKGDVWNIVNADLAHGIKAGDNVAWNGTDWDDLSGTVDLSIYAEKADYQKTITSATADGATITFNHKDGTTSTAVVNNVASATAATNDAKGQRIDTTYEKVTDASNVHTSLQNSINSLSTSKQDKLTFDLTPTADSSNPVTSSGIKTALDGKPSNTGAGASGTWGINITGNSDTATKLSTARAITTDLASTYYASFDGSANITPGVTGILSVANGGTGQSDLSKVNVGGANALNSWEYRPATANNTFADGKVRCYLASSNMTTGKPPRDGVILHLPWDNAFWDAQLFVSTDDETVAVRSQRGSVDWSNSTGWRQLAFDNEVPKNNGTGASGTWGIDITGTATKATQDGNGNVIAETYLKKAGDTVTGTLNVPTQATTDNSTKVANTAFVQSAVDNKVSQLVNSAPETLDTLNELSNALGNDPNFATTVTNMVGQKVDKTGTGASGTWNIGISGNAATATKLSTARTIQTNLASTSSASFDGTANVAPGVTGILPVANGGTGVSSLANITVGNATADAYGNNIANTYATKADTYTKTESDTKYAPKSDTYTKTETEDKIKTLAPTPFNSDKHLVFPSGAEMWVE